MAKTHKEREEQLLLKKEKEKCIEEMLLYEGAGKRLRVSRYYIMVRS